ncbi:hypothetical protein D3C76_1413490 [compost metagenome]
MLADQVDLAQQQHISKLHLFDQQVADGSLIVVPQGFATARQAVRRLIIAQEVKAIDHRHHGVQPCHVA